MRSWLVRGLPALILFAAASAFLFLSRDASLSGLREAGVIRIGYAVEPPYAFLGPDGEVTGESPEIAKRVVAGLDISRIEWRQVEFGRLIDELEAGRIDVIAAGMFVTDERARRVRFSTPTFHVRPGLLVGGGNPRGIRSYRQAAAGDFRIAVLAGAVEEQILRRLGVSDARLILVPDALTGRQAVESGLADALMLSEPTVGWMAAQDNLGRTERLGAGSASTTGNDSYGQVAFAFQRGDRHLVEAWDEVLRAYLGGADHRALLNRLGLSGATPTEANQVGGKSP